MTIKMNEERDNHTHGSKFCLSSINSQKKGKKGLEILDLLNTHYNKYNGPFYQCKYQRLSKRTSINKNVNEGNKVRKIVFKKSKF